MELDLYRCTYINMDGYRSEHLPYGPIITTITIDDKYKDYLQNFQTEFNRSGLWFDQFNIDSIDKIIQKAEKITKDQIATAERWKLEEEKRQAKAAEAKLKKEKQHSDLLLKLQTMGLQDSMLTILKKKDIKTLEKMIKELSGDKC